MESRQLLAASSLEAPTLAGGASGGRNLRASRRPHPARLKAAAPPPSPPAKGLASAGCAAAGFGQLRVRCRIDLSRHQIDLRRRRIELRSLQIELRLHLPSDRTLDAEAASRPPPARPAAEGARRTKHARGRAARHPPTPAAEGAQPTARAGGQAAHRSPTPAAEGARGTSAGKRHDTPPRLPRRACGRVAAHACHGGRADAGRRTRPSPTPFGGGGREQERRRRRGAGARGGQEGARVRVGRRGCV